MRTIRLEVQTVENGYILRDVSPLADNCWVAQNEAELLQLIKKLLTSNKSIPLVSA